MIEKLSPLYGTDVLLIDLPLTQSQPDILDKIARYSSNESVLIKIIKNPITLNSTIDYLAASQIRKVRNEIIDRPGVSQKALDTILFMQGKLRIPVDLLNELAEDSRFYLLRLLTKSPETPSEALQKIATSQHYDDVLREYQYALDYWDIFDNIALHLNSSFDTLNYLTSDRNWNYRDPKIRSIVKDRLKEKNIVSPKMTNRQLPIRGDRYSRENLYEATPDDECPF
jgi:hypothetical protein